jgi:hypothetical protein
MKCNNLYSGLVTPSSGWWSPIKLKKVFFILNIISDTYYYVDIITSVKSFVEQEKTWNRLNGRWGSKNAIQRSYRGRYYKAILQS